MQITEPALVLWIIGVPFLLAIVDLGRTRSAIRKSPVAERGAYSKTLNINPARVARAVP